jgi:hypothetical protein
MKPPKYIAQLQHVREVSLVGGADLAWWTEHLLGEGLLPAVTAGRAQIMISGIDSKFMGLPFRELVIAAFTTSSPGSDQRDGAYLLHAFNSSRLLAWSERTLFSTPYVHAQVDVAIGPPAKLLIMQSNKQLLRAELADGDPAGSRQPQRAGDELWEGPIYLPSRPGGDPASRQQFYGRVGGFTRTYSFDPRDSLALEPPASAPVLQILLDSGFAATQWAIRDDAHHARSKTVRRPPAHAS